MSSIVHIQGSDGDLTVDQASGDILTRDGETEGGTAYLEITRFDPATLTDSHMDILECGYWSADGAYEPPEPDFMAHVANINAGGEGLL